ncbi:hypothetical protein ARALYDRAFT_351855 [Arabidopsis lyrata subsp. lyrata]|uniref:Uncharacterized protein n=2 Tax=Arabidopsis lyrata subsp. lyrata TaxID=81972 RepID=D7M705_ARALL|nr:hypothetical protein ARALYDRAFT_351855 [Arabidopsis lyrata subsp. lyrata]
MAAVAADGDPPLPEPPDPPDPPNHPSCFVLISISNPSPISPPFTHFHLPLSLDPVLDLGSSASSFGGSPFASLRIFTAVCSPWFQTCSQICLLSVGSQAKAVGNVVSPPLWPVTRRLMFLQSGSDVSPAPLASVPSRSFRLSSTVSSKWAWAKNPLVGFNPIASLSIILKAMAFTGFIGMSTRLGLFFRVTVKLSHCASILPVIAPLGSTDDPFPVFLRIVTAACSPWKLVYFQIFGYPFDTSGSDSLVLTPVLHDISPPSVLRASITLSLAQNRLWFHTCVTYSMASILVCPPPIQNFASVRSITAICSFFVFIMAFGAVILVSLSWWQVERPPPMNLDMLGIWCPGSSLTEQFLFPKFPPMWSGLDVEALSVLQGSSSRLKLLSAFDADYVISRVTTDAVFQESMEIVLVVRFPLCYSYDLYRLSIYLLTIVICLLTVGCNSSL